MSAGRPPIFKNANELQNAIDNYFNTAVTKRKVIIGKQPNQQVIEIDVPTITGLCYCLGFESRQSFYDYEKKDGFGDIIRKARKMVAPTNNKRKFDYKNDYTPSSRVIERRYLDPTFKVKTNFAALLRHHLKNKNKNKTFEILGYSVEQLMKHLESKFVDGMTWNNYGSYWHIDHKIPASIFQYNSHKDKGFKMCWDLCNLQPLLKVDNLKKGNRLFQ
jgi:hypothetical protein